MLFCIFQVVQFLVDWVVLLRSTFSNLCSMSLPDQEANWITVYWKYHLQLYTNRRILPSAFQGIQRIAFLCLQHRVTECSQRWKSSWSNSSPLFQCLLPYQCWWSFGCPVFSWTWHAKESIWSWNRELIQEFLGL